TAGSTLLTGEGHGHPCCFCRGWIGTGRRGECPAGLALGLAVVILQSIASVRIRVSVPVGRPVDGWGISSTRPMPAARAPRAPTASRFMNLSAGGWVRTPRDVSSRVHQDRLQAALRSACAAARPGGGIGKPGRPDLSHAFTRRDALRATMVGGIGLAASGLV